MSRKSIVSFFTVLLLLAFPAMAQDDLMSLLQDDDPGRTDYTTATFKTTRLVTGQSVENPAEGVLLFLIQHRFGKINDGTYELFGLDQATMRLGFEYGVSDRLSLGLGRSTYEKTYDGFVKYKILRQSRGKRNMPVTLAYFGNMTINSLKWADKERTNYTSSRFSFTNQALIARKFSESFSLQLMPTHVHQNLVPEKNDANDIFAMGAGGRMKFTRRASLNLEYFYVPTGQVGWEHTNCLSLGLDVETGGHVFQLIFTNTKAMFEPGFIAHTAGKWDKGDIYFGFNLSRVFTVKKPKSFK